MKRAISYSLWVTLLLLAACSKHELGTAPAPSPTVHTLQAGITADGPETRSRFSLDETEARVLWTRGDSFKMIRMNESNYSSATYSTEDDGVESATFTTNKTLSGSDLTSGYPANVVRVGRRGEMGCYLIMPVPSEQTAVPGGIEEGLNRAAAWSSSQEADLHFYNLLSFVRFRVDGSCVSTLASVTFDAGTTVAGDATSWFENGVPYIDFSKKWSTVTFPRSTSITLAGPFVEGQDYLMAMVPATLSSGFNMVFKDEEGHALLKHSGKALTLNRGRIVDFGTIHLGDDWEPETPDIIEYVHQEKGRKKNVIAVLADGFTESEQDKFEMLAKSGIDYLFSVEPYKSYKEYFTAYICRVVSNESGGGVTDGSGNVVTPVDNYFGSRWGSDSYSDMTANANTVKDFLKTHIPEIISGELSYTDVPTLLLINDTRYGGICHIYQGGWAYCQVPYQYEGGDIRWGFPKYQAVNVRDDSEGYRETTDAERDALGRHVGDWRNTLLHEYGGHGYGRLTDEYWSGTTSKYSEPGDVGGHSYDDPYGVNVSGHYDDVPWQADLLDNLDLLLARNEDYARIGIWHGGQTSIYYRWRSEKVSCMIDNRPYFSTWQRMLIVRRILAKAGETFDMDAFLEKDVTFDPIRPVEGESAAVRRQKAARAMMAPEMPMLPPPVVHAEDDL